MPLDAGIAGGRGLQNLQCKKNCEGKCWQLQVQNIDCAGAAAEVPGKEARVWICVPSRPPLKAAPAVWGGPLWRRCQTR
jgi:hypothetical protein